MFRFQMSYQRKFKLESRVAVNAIMFQLFMHKMDKEGKITDTIDPGFSSNMKTTLHMWNFDELYNECCEKIMKDFVEFNANGS